MINNNKKEFKMQEVWIHLKTSEFVLRIFEKGSCICNGYDYGDDFDFDKHWLKTKRGEWDYIGKL